MTLRCRTGGLKCQRSLNSTLWREEAGSRWVGVGPIHKTQGSQPAVLIGPGGKGRVPRVERALGPREWEDLRLGGARGRSLVFPAGLPFSLAVFLLSPPGWGWYVPPSSHSRPFSPPEQRRRGHLCMSG